MSEERGGEANKVVPEKFSDLHDPHDQHIPLTDPQDGHAEKMTDCNRPKTDLVLKEPSPLGLSLEKNESFVNLIHMKLKGKVAPSSESTQDISLEKQKVRIDKRNAEAGLEKFKSPNFPAIMLEIGSWQCVSLNEAGIVAKCYYGKRKLVWEILEEGLKKKIEIQWSDISAIKAHFANKHPDILEVELKQPPLFFEEVWPDPRKHPFWQQTSDFTEGQAPLVRKHHLEFKEGILEKHYDKILQNNKHLYRLSQNSFTSSNSPFFEVVHHEIQDFRMPRPQLHLMLNQPTNILYHSSTDQFSNQGTMNLPTGHVGSFGCMDQSIGANSPVGQLMPPVRAVGENSPTSFGCMDQSISANSPIGQLIPSVRPVGENSPSSDMAFIAAMEHSNVLNYPSNMEYASSVLKNKSSSSDMAFPAAMQLVDLLNYPLTMEQSSSVLNNRFSSSANLDINNIRELNMQSVEEFLAHDDGHIILTTEGFLPMGDQLGRSWIP